MRITNTRTGKTTAAKDGRDLAHMVKVELDRRTGIELATEPDDYAAAEARLRNAELDRQAVA